MNEAALLLLLFVVNDEHNRAINEFTAPWFKVTELVGTSPVKELIPEELVLLATLQLLLEELFFWGILPVFALQFTILNRSLLCLTASIKHFFLFDTVEGAFFWSSSCFVITSN